MESARFATTGYFTNSLIMNIEYILPQDKPNPRTPNTKNCVYCIQTGYHSNNINTTLQPSQTSLVVIIILACNLQMSNNLAATQTHSIVLLVCFPSSSFELLTQYPCLKDDHEILINQRFDLLYYYWLIVEKYMSMIISMFSYIQFLGTLTPL